MYHLENPLLIFVMVVYSVLTYFIGPFIVMPFMLSEMNTVSVGFGIGFVISMILWLTFGSSLIE